MNLAQSYLGEKTLQQVIKYILKDPEKNIPLLINWAEKIAHEPQHKESIISVRRFLEDKDSNWYKLAVDLLNGIHPSIKERLVINFFLNANLLGVPRQRELEKSLDIGVPWAILMDPTERCNLRCTGCWAGDYQSNQELDFETMDRVCQDAEELGIYFILISGGEPTLKRRQIFRLAENHPSQVFHLFTNGILIDEEFANEMIRLGNVTVAISIEGFEKTTDERRGKGVFQKVLKAMDLLRDKGVLFGFSTTYTRKNTEEIASDAFIDLMLSKGAAFGWYFTYIPIGKDVDLDYMATPEQRRYMYRRIQDFRKNKPIFVVDFWNDGEASNGCVAGGRRYFHINAAGDVEPCAFVHFATCNIKDVTLRQALGNPLFRAYRKRQPFSENLRRPCPLIDVPGAMRDMIQESKAHSTQIHDQETIEEFVKKMESYSRAWAEMADEIWSTRESAAVTRE